MAILCTLKVLTRLYTMNVSYINSVTLGQITEVRLKQTGPHSGIRHFHALTSTQQKQQEGSWMLTRIRLWV